MDGAAAPETADRGAQAAAGMPVLRFVALVLLTTFVLVAVTALARPSFGTRLATAAGLRETPVATPGSFYLTRVEPVLEAHCTSCHGVDRNKGKLRLDSFGQLALGGRTGPAVAPGDLDDSLLWTRVTLKPDDPLAMPPKGKTPLEQDELAVLRLWIEHGASPQLAAASVRNAPPLPKVVTFPTADPARVVQERAPLAQTVADLQQRFPGVIAYASRGSADIQVNAAVLGERFGDEDLAAMAPLAPHIVELDASRTAITDASAPLLKTMSRLRRVRLNHSSVGEATAETLASIGSLQSVAIVGTSITADDLGSLAGGNVNVYVSGP